MERSEWGKLLSFFPQADEIRGAFSSFSICVCGQRGTEDNALNYYPLSGRQKKRTGLERSERGNASAMASEKGVWRRVPPYLPILSSRFENTPTTRRREIGI